VTRPLISNHGSEIILLGLIALGVVVLCGFAIWRDNAAEASAWTAVLMAIINAVKERWTQRSVDMATTRLHASKPDPEASAMGNLDKEESS